MSGERLHGIRLRSEPRASDVEAVARIVAATGMFSDEETAIAAELVTESLSVGSAAGYHYLFAEREGTGGPGRLVGYSCFGPIPATRESFDLYWIAVEPDLQGAGLGRRLLSESERRVWRLGGRRVYVDTAGREQYAPTRSFYEATGYTRVATLPDFYSPGDAKVIYCKVLAAEDRTAG